MTLKPEQSCVKVPTYACVTGLTKVADAVVRSAANAEPPRNALATVTAARILRIRMIDTPFRMSRALRFDRSPIRFYEGTRRMTWCDLILGANREAGAKHM